MSDPGDDEQNQGSSSDQESTSTSANPTERVRVTSTSARHQVHYDRPQEAVITAEIPVARAARPSTAPRYMNPQPNARAMAPYTRPDAAPAPLRLLVWTMLFFFILIFVGFLAVLVHPGWMSFLRNTESAPQAVGNFAHLFYA